MQAEDSSKYVIATHTHVHTRTHTNAKSTPSRNYGISSLSECSLVCLYFYLAENKQRTDKTQNIFNLTIEYFGFIKLTLNKID